MLVLNVHNWFYQMICVSLHLIMITTVTSLYLNSKSGEMLDFFRFTGLGFFPDCLAFYSTYICSRKFQQPKCHSWKTSQEICTDNAYKLFCTGSSYFSLNLTC